MKPGTWYNHSIVLRLNQRMMEELGNIRATKHLDLCIFRLCFIVRSQFI